MIEIASQIVLCLVLAAFIGFLIGFIIGKAFGGGRTKVYSSIPSNMHNKVQANVYNKPLIRSAPRPGGKDDLKEIEGIDIELEGKLNELGIFHFDQITKWNARNCHWVEEYFILEDNQVIEQDWVGQAKNFETKISVRSSV
ncbi:MAG: hypothetical protein ACNI25_14340 [Halarcobacter sp.]